MLDRYSRLRWRRKLRRHKKTVVDIGETANKHIDRHFFRRWHNFRDAGRFSIGWLGLVLLLIISVAIQTRALGRFYLIQKPVEGGVYSEGLIGNFSNANPIYATSEVDMAVSKLVFDPLISYDEKNQLVGDLAKSWEVDKKETTYTIKLNKNLFWHDGHVLNADDVVFTYTTIQNPDAKSPLLSNWTGVKIEKVDDNTVKFILPNAYSPFLHSLTTGIIPKHLLKDIPPTQLRSYSFNNENPIGSGPFAFKESSTNNNGEAQIDTIQLVKFDKYHDGQAKLDGVTFKTYDNQDNLFKALKVNKIITAAGLNITDKEIPINLETTSFTLMGANMLFIKTTAPVLNNVKIRQAFIKATDVPALISKIGYAVVPVTEPILKSQIGYNPAYSQFAFNKKEAENILELEGWKYAPKDQFRSKNGKQLKISLSYENSPDFARIADALQKQWADVGINLTVDVSQDNKQSRKYIDNHDYEVLLYGINIGQDPDVYAYWHSSQISIRNKIHLNLSEYKSTATDLSLESGRTRSDVKIRAIKYKPFLEVWRNDAPAIGLYQPRYLYVSGQHIYNLGSQKINTSTDRFNNIHDWMINVSRQQQ